ncbi:putative IS1381 transposase [Streptococcus pneumoniae]|nr:putative IS1381 transposase [Streptococcus pneumoniae]
MILVKKCHAMKAQAIVTSQGRIISLDITVNYSQLKQEQDKRAS